MARPNKLNTKGYFSVIDSGCGCWQLVFKGKHIIRTSPSRHHLYTARAAYSSLFENIVALLKSTGAELKDL